MTAPVTPRRPRWRNLALLALLLAPLLWPLQQLAERYYSNELIEQNRQTLDLYVANLLGILSRYEVLPRILGDLPALRAALHGAEEPAVRDSANRLLKKLHRQTGADVIYLMDLEGTTLASSNWDDPDSFVGRNFAFRPYFRQAMEGQGRLGRFFGLGNTSGKRGYYFGAAVYEDEKAIGVLVVKVDLDHTETLWGNTPERLLVTDNFGVVILTSQPEWRFRATRGLEEDEREQIRFDQPYTTLNPRHLTLDIDSWLIQSRELKEIDWTVRILAPVSLVERPVRTVVAIGAATLLALLLWLGLLMQRRRHFIERLALDTRARQQLEQRVQERTRDLEALNRRLKVEVLEREQAQQELVRAQDELLQAGKLSALGTMSASISHELNQPLGAIRSYADNAGVLLDQQRNEEARDNLKLISELTARMASIIAHLRAFARRDRHAPERVALQPALDDALALLAKRRQALGVELIRDLPEATLWVQAGETRLRQILSNLLANALDALKERPPERRIWLRAERNEDGVLLTLRDNGPGFSTEALQRAREPFFTTKTSTQGLGLGLAICDTLARALDGELTLANHPEGGAQLCLYLRSADPGVTFPSED
ncbi:sensor histidine kinase [Stutzerimonas nitrititolerans]|uniref:C4-dicarboxylate transport sensor protein DctB n=1 Tax=Stutzerimonas nitrititolerans TaxID=2482751 RepID=A0AA42BEE0_9GAMM|nr:ATP-binding protein [Stutzerimonas nitrititolerans]AFN76193.1 C4 dicarboxylate transport sensor protein [Stutzerimonas stutzeri DSM 10701]KRW70300.1 ATPase [Pseudomonas sp. TTU2014-066ASC]MBA1185484.1 sensor histidine kinase [Stutzerimonas stutzeri]HAQ24505.1 sensor histidine kinase [Pseudomonas sp.]MBA1233395.1 sensor histidine kinase [Stutzerimonas stutzeri]